jgi:hypothetical protein
MHKIRYPVSDSDSEEESKVLSKVDIVPSKLRVSEQPEWTQLYKEQTEREKIHSKYVKTLRISAYLSHSLTVCTELNKQQQQQQ